MWTKIETEDGIYCVVIVDDKAWMVPANTPGLEAFLGDPSSQPMPEGLEGFGESMPWPSSKDGFVIGHINRQEEEPAEQAKPIDRSGFVSSYPPEEEEPAPQAKPIDRNGFVSSYPPEEEEPAPQAKPIDRSDMPDDPKPLPIPDELIDFGHGAGISPDSQPPESQAPENQAGDGFVLDLFGAQDPMDAVNPLPFDHGHGDAIDAFSPSDMPGLDMDVAH